MKSNKGAAGVDQVDIDAIRDYGEDRFLNELEQELRSRQYRTALVRRVHIPKPGQPGKTRPLGIPTVKDRVVQMAVKLVIEPLFEADFMPCSFGFRPKKTPRMALSAIVQSVNDGYSFVVDVDLKSYFDTISHELLLELVERRVGDVQVLRLIRAWLKAGVMEEGKVTHPGPRFSSGRSDFADAVQHLSARGRSSMVPERRCRPRQCSAGPLCGRHGAAGANGTTRRGRRGSNSRVSLPLFDWW